MGHTRKPRRSCCEHLLLRIPWRRWRGRLEAEQSFRRIIRHEDLWMLKAVLDEGQSERKRAEDRLDEGRLAA